MVDIMLYVAAGLLIVIVVLLLVLLKKVTRWDPAALFSRLDAVDKAQERTEDTVRDEVARSGRSRARPPGSSGRNLPNPSRPSAMPWCSE